MSDKDLIMMYAAHQAFRRDLRKLVGQPTLERWRQFSDQLFKHHTAEDTVLWPQMRSRGADRALLDAMEAEHAQIDPLLSKVTAAFEAKVPTDQVAHLKALSELLDAHLHHEESEVLPLITEREWSALDREMRRRIGLRNMKAYFSWLLEDAPSDLRDRLRKALPPPARLLIARTPKR